MKEKENEKVTIEFEEWELLKDLNHADLNEDGDFFADYITVNLTGLEESDTIDEFVAHGTWIQGDQRQETDAYIWIDWSRTSYEPITVLDVKLGNVPASDLFNAAWKDWDLNLDL